MPTLDKCIQALCQELQDMILDFTIAPPVESIVVVKRDYKPPLGLQVNRKTRAAFAAQYYGTNTFAFSDGYDYIGEKLFKATTTYRFLGSLPASHLTAIQHVFNADITLFESEFVVPGIHIAFERFVVWVAQRLQNERRIICDCVNARFDPQKMSTKIVTRDGSVKVVTVGRAGVDGRSQHWLTDEEAI